ncbi:MAG: SDR family oxidoreductase [Acidobacteriaceae bacterium]
MRIKARLDPGKTALVTGGSSGIGKAIACGLAERGLHVWLLAQRQELLDSARIEVETHRQNQAQAIRAISADVSDLDQVRLAVRQILDQAVPPDILINSAGVSHPGYIQELDIQVFQWMMAVNYFGTVYMTKEILPAFLEKGSGYIVNVSSLAAIYSYIGYTAYGASKFAVRGFSDALRSEMRLHNIGVSIVYPTDTDTPQLEYENRFKPPETKALGNLGGSMMPGAVASAILKGIERGQYQVIPGLEGKFWYLVDRLFGVGLKNMVIDQIIASEAKKKNSVHPKEA